MNLETKVESEIQKIVIKLHLINSDIFVTDYLNEYCGVHVEDQRTGEMFINRDWGWTLGDLDDYISRHSDEFEKGKGYFI